MLAGRIVSPTIIVLPRPVLLNGDVRILIEKPDSVGMALAHFTAMIFRDQAGGTGCGWCTIREGSGDVGLSCHGRGVRWGVGREVGRGSAMTWRHGDMMIR